MSSSPKISKRKSQDSRRSSELTIGDASVNGPSTERKSEEDDYNDEQEQEQSYYFRMLVQHLFNCLVS
jgi:hypothetical protein